MANNTAVEIPEEQTQEPICNVKRISTTIGKDLWLIAQNYDIQWSKALRVGIQMELFERNIEFDDREIEQLRVFYNIKKLQDLLQKASKEIQELKLSRTSHAST